MWPDSATSDAWLETLTIAPPLPSRTIDCGGVFRHKQRAAGVDRDHLVEDGDVGFHRRRDLAAEAAAVDHAPEVEPVEGAAHLVLRW